MNGHAPEDDETSSDPALAPFLALLEADLAARPAAEAMRALPTGLVSRLEALAAELGNEDPDEPIAGEVSL